MTGVIHLTPPFDLAEFESHPVHMQTCSQWEAYQVQMQQIFLAATIIIYHMQLAIDLNPCVRYVFIILNITQAFCSNVKLCIVVS